MNYHCPYCGATIQHRPEMAGDRVQCSKCSGEYFEPTDPLPGILPEKAPDFKQSAQSRATVSSSELQPADMAAQLQRCGLDAVIITKAENQPVNVAFSHNLTADQANDLILKSAVNIMKTRWPDVYQLVSNRVSS